MPKSSNIFPPRPGAEATGRSGIVSRCNNIHICTLFDAIYVYIHSIQTYVNISLYLDLYLYVPVFLCVSIPKPRSKPLCLAFSSHWHLYLYLCLDLFPPRPGRKPPAAADLSQGVTTFMYAPCTTLCMQLYTNIDLCPYLHLCPFFSYVYLAVYMFANINLCPDLSPFTSLSVSSWECMSAKLLFYLCFLIRVCAYLIYSIVYTQICISSFIYVYMYMYIYSCLCIYTCTHVYFRTCIQNRSVALNLQTYESIHRI